MISVNFYFVRTTQNLLLTTDQVYDLNYQNLLALLVLIDTVNYFGLESFDSVRVLRIRMVKIVGVSAEDLSIIGHSIMLKAISAHPLKIKAKQFLCSVIAEILVIQKLIEIEFEILEVG